MIGGFSRDAFDRLGSCIDELNLINCTRAGTLLQGSRAFLGCEQRSGLLAFVLEEFWFASPRDSKDGLKMAWRRLDHPGHLCSAKLFSSI